MFFHQFCASYLPGGSWVLHLIFRNKGGGRVKTLGQVLAIWTFIIAAFILLAGAYVTSTGLCSMDMMGEFWTRGGTS